MNIAIIGTGYVGLVTGVCLAEIGHSVTCIDIDENKVKKMNQGVSPIYEPGLDELMTKNIKHNQLTFTTSHEKGLVGVDVIYIAVGTPQSEDGSADLGYVLQAAKDIAAYIARDTIVITKSTVPVGTNRLVKATILEHLSVNVNIEVVSNPEFLREGHAINDTFHGERIVIGADDMETASIVEKIYGPLKIPILLTGIESAELIKYASNAFLATKISFINEMANLCEIVGASVSDVAKGMGMDNRIGSAFLNAGIGYGGSCFPKDTNALQQIGSENGYEFKIIQSVIDVNQKQPLRFVEKVMARFPNMKNKNVAILGLAFKSNTDDMREAPSITIINELLKQETHIVAYDPVATMNARKILSSEVKFAETLYDTLDGADLCLVLTEWDEFKTIDIQKMKELMKSPIVFDGRNCLPSEKLKELGFEYYTIDSSYSKDAPVNKEAIYA